MPKNDYNIFEVKDAIDLLGERQAYAFLLLDRKPGPDGTIFTADIDTVAVEDFSIQFYTKYNKLFPGTY